MQKSYSLQPPPQVENASRLEQKIQNISIRCITEVNEKQSMENKLINKKVKVCKTMAHLVHASRSHPQCVDNVNKVDSIYWPIFYLNSEYSYFGIYLKL